MTKYQNCLAHSLQLWNKAKYYNLFYDGNHVVAVTAEHIKGYIEITEETSGAYWKRFDIDEDEWMLLRQYYIAKKGYDIGERKNIS